MDERDNKEGEYRREIELEMRYVGEGMEHTRNTTNSPTKENKFIYQKQHASFFYNCPFYREEKEGS